MELIPRIYEINLYVICKYKIHVFYSQFVDDYN